MLHDIKIKRAVAFVIVVFMLVGLPILPAGIQTNTNNVYAANDYTINLSDASGNVRIRVSGGSIWVSTGGDLSDTGLDNITSQVVLVGTANSKSVTIDNATGAQAKVDIKLKDAEINCANDNAGAFNVTSNTALSLELEGNNYITNNAQNGGSAVQMNGADTDLTITGDGFLSAVMSDQNAKGSAIGAGYLNNPGVNRSIGDITIGGGAKVYASVPMGAAIGGGYAGTNSKITTGAITIDGGFTTASGGGADIGAGTTVATSTIHVPKVIISGGSVFAKNNKISPAAVSATGASAHKVTVPAINGQLGADISVSLGGGRSYKAKTVSAEAEHGQDFPVSAGAFIYLPIGNYSDISVGNLKGYTSNDTIMIYQTVTAIKLNPSSVTLTQGTSKRFYYDVVLGHQDTWYMQDLRPQLSVNSMEAGVVDIAPGNWDYSGTIDVTATKVGRTELEIRLGNVSTYSGIQVTPMKNPLPTFYYITALCSSGGSINDSGIVGVKPGANKTFTFYPDRHYIIKDVIVDGVSVGTPSAYTFKSVFDNHTIEVEFEYEYDPFPFEDVPMNRWFREAIEYVYYNNLMIGTSKTLFKPGDNLSRARAAAVFTRMDLGYEKAEKLVPKGGIFNDIPATHYYSKYIAYAFEEGILFGDGEGNFRPDDPITRAEVAIMIVRYAEMKGLPYIRNESDYPGYSDESNNSIVMYQIKEAWLMGLMEGTGKGKFEPQKPLTRAEMAQLLMNLFEKVRMLDN